MTFSLTFAVILTLKRWTDECHNSFIFKLTSHIRGLFLNLFETPANSSQLSSIGVILSTAQTHQKVAFFRQSDPVPTTTSMAVRSLNYLTMVRGNTKQCTARTMKAAVEQNQQMAPITIWNTRRRLALVAVPRWVAGLTSISQPAKSARSWWRLDGYDTCGS